VDGLAERDVGVLLSAQTITSETTSTTTTTQITKVCSPSSSTQTRLSLWRVTAQLLALQQKLLQVIQVDHKQSLQWAHFETSHFSSFGVITQSHMRQPTFLHSGWLTLMPTMK